MSESMERSQLWSTPEGFRPSWKQWKKETRSVGKQTWVSLVAKYLFALNNIDRVTGRILRELKNGDAKHRKYNSFNEAKINDTDKHANKRNTNMNAQEYEQQCARRYK